MQRKTLAIACIASIFLYGTASFLWPNQAPVADLSQVSQRPQNSKPDSLTLFTTTGPDRNAHSATQASAEQPNGVAAQDKSALVASLAKLGQPPEDADKLIAQIRYQRQFDELQYIDEHDAPLRQKIARQLVAELPQRVKDNHYTVMEATFMGVFLMADLEANKELFDAALAIWQAKLAQAGPQNTTDEGLTQQNRTVEWHRQQADAFSQWSDRTELSERTQASLDELMAQARRP